ARRAARPRRSPKFRTRPSLRSTHQDRETSWLAPQPPRAPRFSRNRPNSRTASASLSATSSPDKFPYPHCVMADVGFQDRSRLNASSILPEDAYLLRTSPDRVAVVRPPPITA